MIFFFMYFKAFIDYICIVANYDHKISKLQLLKCPVQVKDFHLRLRAMYVIFVKETWKM